MNILAIETSSRMTGIAVCVDGLPPLPIHCEGGARQSEQLIELIEGNLRKANLGVRDLELIAVGIGPGFFTGLRVGLATAKALAWGLGIPLVGVPTSQVLARSVQGDLCLTLIDGGHEQLFVAAYQKSPEGLLEVLHPVSVRLSSLVEHVQAMVSEHKKDAHPAALVSTCPLPQAISFALEQIAGQVYLNYPDPLALKEEAIALFQRRGPDDPLSIRPIYARDADITLPRSP
ncbi:MAG: tRNA (adenosine(37)-N6)-threonylcarbamoyltransferase complex dimerization subunit type 1 TsaB [Deltaproteobacteria bacterium]|nr:tRNA (adenosine(37)-N6)-threonylcarbamoyltransferase complex dimerization subunit type 1 TsaB [Deltaproteobacteria bacterium]